MEQYIEIITINLIPGGMKPACHASQYDKGRVIRANLVNGLTPYSIKSGDVFTLNVKKPDGNIVTVEVDATEGNTYVDFSTTEQMCAVAGKNNCEFSIENGSDLIGTANFFMIVEASPLEGGIESESEINNLTRQVHDIVVEELEDSGFAQIDDTSASENKTYSSEKIETLLEDKANAENVDYMIEEETDVSTSTAFTKYPETSGNVYNGNNVRIESNANYDSYLLILNKATSIYFGGTLPAYVAICYGLPPVQKEADRDRWGCSSATRYRNLDSNLPTKATPLSVVKNGIIVITITKGATVSLFGLGLAYKFTDNASKQITDIINLKKPIVTKDTTASGYVTERLYVHIPTKVGYVQYDFAHYVNASTNANTWNIRMTNAVDDDLTNRYLITTTGEFECAIKIDGAPDFMGGIAHGSEVITDIQFFIDGKKTTLANIVSGASFDELRVCVVSNLYNPSDEITIVAEHSKEYIFNENGLTINQMVKWLGSYTLTDSYLAMFPSSKDVIDYLRVNNKIDTYTLAQTTPSIASGTNHAYSFGDNLLCDFDISTWEINAQTKSGVGAYFITDNGGQNYWKQYYKALASGTVANGDTWLTSTFYKIQIGA